MKKKKNGFSLVELIVVITIIAVITAVGVISFSGTNKKSRDSRRMADLEKIRMALEIYRQENGIYPSNSSSLSPTYIQAWPTDPKSYTYYYLRGVGSSYTYALDAQMENVGSTNGSFGANCGGTCNYRVTNP